MVEVNIVMQKGARFATAHPCLCSISAAGVNSVMRKRKHKLQKRESGSRRAVEGCCRWSLQLGLFNPCFATPSEYSAICGAEMSVCILSESACY